MKCKTLSKRILKLGLIPFVLYTCWTGFEYLNTSVADTVAMLITRTPLNSQTQRLVNQSFLEKMEEESFKHKAIHLGEYLYYKTHSERHY